MRQYDFTLKFALASHEAEPENFVERLLGEGCDDAIIGIGQRGRIALNIVREAASAEDAMLSALADVRRVIPDARFVEATPDLVGLSDLASLLGVSRQYVRKLVEVKGPEFPLPVHDGKRPIWHLAAVLAWFATHRNRKVDAALLDMARVNMYCNHIREQTRLDRMSTATEREIADRLRRAVAA